MSRQTKHSLVLGFIVVLIGVAALADNLNLFSFHNLFHFWPTIFLVVGLVKLTRAKHISKVFGALCFIAVGILMTLNEMGIIHLSWHTTWPLILIAVGIGMLLKSFGRDTCHQGLNFGEEINHNNSWINVSTMMGGTKVINSSPDFKGGQISAVMGGVRVDLRNAKIQSQATIEVHAMWGGIEIKIPNDWTVINRSTAFLGGMEDKTSQIVDTGKHLIITGTAVMGGVDIKN